MSSCGISVSMIPGGDFLLRWKQGRRALRQSRRGCCTKSLWRAGYFWGFHLKPGPGILKTEVQSDAVFRF